MSRRLILVAIATLTLAIAGCATDQGQQQQTGTVVGGVLGGVLGSQIGGGRGTTAAIIVGTIAGAAIGGNIGRTMDEVDRMRMAQTLETQPTGSSNQWRNPDSGANYTVTPTRTFEQNQRPCREYTMDAVIDGRLEQVTGTACRSPSGEWVTQN